MEEQGWTEISIHAPREGGDQDFPHLLKCDPGISIHAPREGGDHSSAPVTAMPDLFQSTPPARGATRSAPKELDTTGISIHAPREGGDFGITLAELDGDISIHAPREGGDLQFTSTSG